jgi:large subunit ribosomal protein L9
MKVILKVDVGMLGDKGKVVEVKDGYARNYLFPRRLAVAATAPNIKQLQQEQLIQKRRLEKRKQEAEKLKCKIDNTSCTIRSKVGPDGKIFGAVTSLQIVQALKEEGIEIDKHAIILNEPLKELGVFKVDVKLHPEVIATVKVWIVED